MDKLITHYVEDISLWRDWQKEYRYGAILVLPPDPPLKIIDEMRTQYDPIMQAVCGAHISLTLPLVREVDEADWEELKQIAAGIKPVTVRYGPLANFLPTPVIFIAIEPKQELKKVRELIENAAVFKDAPPDQYPFIPHMTISETLTAEKTKELMTRLKDVAPAGSFLCTHLSYAVPDKSFHFAERGRLELGKSA
jgi:2'-5' RNA ligase